MRRGRSLRHRRDVHRDALIAERLEQLDQLVATPVDVADDVERAAVERAVVPQRLADNCDRVDLLLRAQDEDLAEPLALEVAQVPLQGHTLAADDVRPELPGRATGVTVVTEPLGNIEHDRDGKDVLLPSELHEGPARLRIDVRRVHDRQAAAGEALGGDVMEEVKGVARSVLAVLIIGNDAAASVGGDNLRGLEVPARKGGLAGAGGSDEGDETEFGQVDAHGAKVRTATENRGRWPDGVV